jgi:hypothetical protein
MVLMQTPDEIRSYFKIENGEYFHLQQSPP